MPSRRGAHSAPWQGIDRTEEIRKIVEGAGLKFLPLKIEDAFATSSNTPSTSLVMDSTSLGSISQFQLMFSS